ncbi:MAG: hypothetical protein R6W89_01165 [Candidatus Hydrogenedentota bacterium]
MMGSRSVGSWIRIVGVCLAVALAGFLAWRAWAEVRARRVTAELREEGHPLTFHEFAERYASGQPPDADNAAVLYLEAMDAYERELGAAPPNDLVPIIGFADPPPPGEPFPPEQAEAVKAYLDAFTDTLALLGKAAERPACHWPLDFAWPAESGCTSIAPFRSFSRLLNLKALWQAHHGQGEDAAKTLLTHWVFVRNLQKAKMYIFSLQSTSFQGLAEYSITDVLSRVDFPDAYHAELAALLEEVETTDNLREIVQTEWLIYWDPEMVVGELKGLRALPTLPRNPDWVGLRAALYRLLGGQARDTPRLAEVYRACLEHAERSRPARLRHWPAFEEWLLDAEIPSFFVREAPSWAAPRNLSGASVSFAGLTGPHEMQIIRATSTAAARAGLAVDAYRQDHGRLPETLEQLVPDYLDKVPKDYYTGAPLAYMHDDPAYAVYDVGLEAVQDEPWAAALLEQLGYGNVIRIFAIHWTPDEVADMLEE